MVPPVFFVSGGYVGQAVLSTPGVQRVFIACAACQRVMPHYRVYGQRASNGQCRCGSNTFKPRRIPEWKAMFWVLVVGWLWRKTLRREPEWDPRMPIRQV